MDFDDSHVSGHVGFLPVLKCYDFHGFEPIPVFRIDCKIYSNFHGLAAGCLPNLSVRNVWRSSALGSGEPLGGNTSRTRRDTADVESVTISTIPARGIQECLVFSMDFHDSQVSGHVGFLPLLRCYDFNGFEPIPVFHIDGKIYSNFHGLAPACLPNLSVHSVWRTSALGSGELTVYHDVS